MGPRTGVPPDKEGRTTSITPYPLEHADDESRRPSSDAELVRALVVDGRAVLRLGLESALERAGVQVVASCATTAEAIARLAGGGCDVVLLGVAADTTSFDAIHRIRASVPLAIVLVADDPRPAATQAALRAGAVGLVASDAAPERIVAVVRAAAAGLAAIDPAALAHVLRATAADGAPTALGLGVASAERTSVGPIVAERLSARDRELLRYLAEGYTNKEIARVMTLAEDTVKKGVQSLIAKLGAADRTHAAILAMRAGLIE